MRRPDLVPDCGSCNAVCCIATSFDASEDFALAKSAGTPCPNLDGNRCSIHPERVARGYLGCTLYDCYGAGPAISRTHLEGAARDEAFRRLQRLHELLWMLVEAAKLHASDELEQQTAALEVVVRIPPEQLGAVDLDGIEASVRAVLRRTGERIGGRARLIQLRRC